VLGKAPKITMHHYDPIEDCSNGKEIGDHLVSCAEVIRLHQIAGICLDHGPHLLAAFQIHLRN
jgi:hypothetical protein